MRITDTTPDDAITRPLLEAYFAERVEGFAGGGYRVAPPDPASFRPPGAFLRAEEDDGEPLGVVGLRPLPPEHGETRMEVKHLYVVPGARGRGLGRVLLARVETLARQAGADLLVLDTNRSLEAAGGLYRTSGFEPVAPFNDNPNATDWFGKHLV